MTRRCRILKSNFFIIPYQRHCSQSPTGIFLYKAPRYAPVSIRIIVRFAVQQKNTISKGDDAFEMRNIFNKRSMFFSAFNFS